MHRLVCCYSCTIRPTSDVLQEALEGTVSCLRMFLQYEPRLEQTLCLRGREAFMIHVFWTGLNTTGVPRSNWQSYAFSSSSSSSPIVTLVPCLHYARSFNPRLRCLLVSLCCSPVPIHASWDYQASIEVAAKRRYLVQRSRT